MHRETLQLPNTGSGMQSVEVAVTCMRKKTVKMTTVSVHNFVQLKQKKQPPPRFDSRRLSNRDARYQVIPIVYRQRNTVIPVYRGIL